MVEAAIRTTCPYCGVGCGVLAKQADDQIVLAGDPDHPANYGRLCVKGASLGETLGLDGRLLYPMVGGRRESWEGALSEIAARLSETIAAHGPDSVAFYVSGQLLTEDYYVANKLMKGFIGSANIDTNSRLCMASSVAGHIRAFGEDIVPGNYEDLEKADLVVLTGSNAAWCHPVLFQRILAARATRPGMKLVVIDPRRTATAAEADLHLALRPGSDVALFQGLLTYLASAGLADENFIAAHTTGASAALGKAAEIDAASACDLPADKLATFFRWFGETDRVVTVYSQGVNQSSQGTDKVNAIINCHLLTGRIGREGCGPLSFTGQPNAMGGREVGGLANQLAAHMGFDAAAKDRVQRFWRSPRIAQTAGLKAVEMFQAIHDGRIKFLWIAGTNPAVSLPDSQKIREALARCPTVVLADCEMATDSAMYADILLPAAGWSEKDGTVTNSERRISRQRAFRPLPGEAKPDWWMFAQVAARLGYHDSFDYRSASDIFREHAALSAFENDGQRAFEISALIDRDYDRMTPSFWPARDNAPRGAERLLTDGRYFHSDRRARFIAVSANPPASARNTDFPFVLNTGRVRDQWHSMTRTGKAPSLSSHIAEPILSIHPDDARSLDIVDRGFCRIRSACGTIVLPVRFDDGQRRGEVFAPIHWNDQFAGDALVSRLVAPVTDPHSGQPESKFVPVALEKRATAWHGALLIRHKLNLTRHDQLVWSRSQAGGHHLYRLAGTSAPDSWGEWTRQIIGGEGWIFYQDRAIGLFRAARLEDNRLEAILFVTPAPEFPATDGLAPMFRAPLTDPAERRALLCGGKAQTVDQGPIVCACHQVARRTILDAIVKDGLGSVEAIGAALRAGTQCGSCIPELRAFLAPTPLSHPIGAAP